MALLRSAMMGLLGPINDWPDYAIESAKLTGEYFIYRCAGGNARSSSKHKPLDGVGTAYQR
jgi:hypothetical protein